MRMKKYTKMSKNPGATPFKWNNWIKNSTKKISLRKEKKFKNLKYILKLYD